MFSGIVSHIGKLQTRSASTFIFSASRTLVRKLSKGSSIAINGVCLTVINKSTLSTFTIEIMPETARRTMFDALQERDVVNLELPATAQTLLSGHIVQGHIDGIGILKNIENEGNAKILTVQIPRNIGRYIVEKGSIAINGISLTVVSISKSFLTVAITPFTWSATSLAQAKTGDLFNIEVDIIAKYIEKLTKQ